MTTISNTNDLDITVVYNGKDFVIRKDTIDLFVSEPVLYLKWNDANSVKRSHEFALNFEDVEIEGFDFDSAQGLSEIVEEFIYDTEQEFNDWLSSPPNISIFTNNAGYLFAAASANLTGQNAAVASVASSTPSALGTYQVGCYITITAIMAGTVVAQVTYTDETNTLRTQSFFAEGLTSASITTIGSFAFPPMTIRAKSGAAITVLTTFAGVSVAYNVGAYILKIA